MPIYKIARSGRDEHEARRIHRRMRFAALLVSALLLTSTVTMLLLHAHQ